MSHFAKVLNGIVTNVIVAEPEFFETYVDDSPGVWIQTSYKTFEGQHLGENNKPDNGIPLRGNFANVGMVYDEKLDAFYWPQPFPSWTFNSIKFKWEPPVECPGGELMAGTYYEWNEGDQLWELMVEKTSE